MPTTTLIQRVSCLALFVSAAATSIGVAELPMRLPSTHVKGAPEKPDVAPEETLGDKRAGVQKRLARLEVALQRNPDHVAASSFVKEVELLKWLDTVYSSYETSLERHGELEREADQLEDEFRDDELNGQQLSFIQLDDLRDQLIGEETRLESLDLEIDAARAALEMARNGARDADSRRRRLRDAIEEEADARKVRQMRREHELSKLASQAHGVSVQQQQLELQVRTIEQEITRRRTEHFRRRVDLILGTISLTDDELKTKIEGINHIESSLAQMVADIQKGCQEADRKWRAAKIRHDSLVAEDPVLVEQLAAWRQALDLRRERLGFLKQISTYSGYARVIWRRRFQLANRLGSTVEYTDWSEEVKTTREELARFQQLIGLRANEHFGDTATLKKRMVTIQGGDSTIGPWVQFRATELDELVSQYTSQLVMLKAMDRLLQRFAEDLHLEVKPTSVRQVAARAAELLKAGWWYEITSVDDRPITVGKSVYGVMLFVTGFFSARILSRLVGRRILPRFGLTQGAAQTFQSIAFYLMLTCFGFLALDMVNLPLTVFAFMGGAVAIGVGFGSQNILNNFISGLIVLAERPIRVGDLVEISGLTGTIERIGARSTRLKTGRNLEIIVPNSTFLENNVTNWTLSDTRIRTMVSVGVAYGSPTQEVSRLLRETVTQHDGVLESPSPIILFKDFGDNSLSFEVHFWIHMQTMMQAEKIASDIRHEVDERFAAAEITIAYPQRDVHLDSLAPIEVSLSQFPSEAGVNLRRDAAA